MSNRSAQPFEIYNRPRRVRRDLRRHAPLASRPETIRLGLHTERETHLKAKITEVHFLGSVIRIRANVAGTILAFDTFNTSDAPPPKVGGEVDLSLAGRDLLVLND
jgi:putative spermidine/putrescine transport system ATP-binding protein